MAVTVEVGGHDVDGACADTHIRCGGEGSIASSEQHRDIVRTSVGNHEIGMFITIQVGDCDGGETKSYHDTRCGGEGSIAISE